MNLTRAWDRVGVCCVRVQLEPTWPMKHWDHWLRSVRKLKGRDIVVPEVCGCRWVGGG